MLAKLVALKRNKTAFKFADLEAMDESASDEVLLAKVFSSLSAWKAAKFNKTGKFAADAVAADAADDEVLLTKLWTMLAMKKNKTRFSAPDASTNDADAEFLLGSIYSKLAAWKNKTKKFDAPDVADDEALLASLWAKLAKKNKTAWVKSAADMEGAADEAVEDEAETNQYFLRRLNKTAFATTFNKTALWGAKNKTLLWGAKNKTMWG